MRKYSLVKIQNDINKIMQEAKDNRRNTMQKLIDFIKKHTSPLDREQWSKVFKAIVYSFLAGFAGTFVLLASDFIQAAQTGVSITFDVVVALIVASLISGLNAVAVYLKQLFTPIGK